MTVWSKRGADLVAGFEKLQRRNGGNLPLRLQTDHGTEFFNSHVRAFLRKNSVHHYSSEGDKKAAVLERFNRTWLNKYHKFRLAQTGNSRRKKKKKKGLLDLVVRNYNLTPHTSLEGATPLSMDRDASARLVSRQLDKLPRLRRQRWPTTDLRKNDAVCVANQESTFHKAHRGNFSKEIFIVDRITRRSTSPEIPLFHLRDLTGEQVKGPFYRNQLVRVGLPRRPVVDKIAKNRQKNRWILSLRDYPRDTRRVVSPTEARRNFELP